MNDEATVVPNLHAMKLTLRVNCNFLSIAENSPDVQKIREIGAKHKIKIEVGCGNIPSQAPAVIEIMTHADPQMATLSKKADAANAARLTGNASTDGEAAAANARYEQARSEARASAINAVSDSGIADILNSLQVRLIKTKVIEAPMAVKVAEVSGDTKALASQRQK